MIGENEKRLREEFGDERKKREGEFDALLDEHIDRFESEKLGLQVKMKEEIEKSLRLEESRMQIELTKAVAQESFKCSQHLNKEMERMRFEVEKERQEAERNKSGRDKSERDKSERNKGYDPTGDGGCVRSARGGVRMVPDANTI